MRRGIILAAALALWTLTLVLVAVAVVLITVDRPAAYDLLFYVPEVLAFSTAGALVAWRRPRMLAGWLLVAVGLVWTVVAALHAYVNHILAAGPAGPPAGGLAAWVANWVWILAFVALWSFFLTFPDGRLPDPYWWIVVWVGVVGAALVLVGRSLTPGPLAEFPAIDNPYGAHGGGAILRDAVAVGQLLTAIASIASIASLFVRFRRADRVQRQQLRWMVLAAGVYLAGAVLQDILHLLGGGLDAGDVFLGLIAGVPIAAAIAIMWQGRKPIKGQVVAASPETRKPGRRRAS